MTRRSSSVGGKMFWGWAERQALLAGWHNPWQNRAERRLPPEMCLCVGSNSLGLGAHFWPKPWKMVLPDFCVRAEAFCHLPGLRTSAAHTDGQAINPRLGYRLEGARHIVTYRQQGPSNFSLMAAEEVPRVVGFACLQAMAPAAARPCRDEQPVSPLAALLARQGQAFRRPLVVRTRRPEVDGAFRARSLQLEIRGEVGPDHGSSASAPSSVAGGRHCWQRHHKRQSFLPARFPVGLACCFLWAVTCEVAARYPSAPCSPGTFPLGRAMHMHELPTSRSLVVYVATDSSDGSCLACRAVPPPVVALEELAVELRASAEDAAGLEVTALLAMQHQLAQVWLEPLLISVG